MLQEAQNSGAAGQQRCAVCAVILYRRVLPCMLASQPVPDGMLQSDTSAAYGCICMRFMHGQLLELAPPSLEAHQDVTTQLPDCCCLIMVPRWIQWVERVVRQSMVQQRAASQSRCNCCLAVVADALEEPKDHSKWPYCPYTTYSAVVHACGNLMHSSIAPDAHHVQTNQ